MEFLQQIINILNQTGALNVDKTKTPVINFEHPSDLQQSLNLKLSDAPLDDPTLIQLLTKVVDCSVKTSHPYFFNQLYGGLDLYGLAGSWITEALNTSQYTYEVAPVFTLVEQTILQHVAQQMVQYSNGDGIFSPGGSTSNMYAMVMARYRKIPDVKTKGMGGVKLTAFTSQDAHYSIEKGAHWLGLGTENLIKIKTNEAGQMIPAELEAAVIEAQKNGRVPFFVNATAGTTVLGAFDPFKEIAAICQKYNMWMHIDGCWGGSLLLSNKYKHRLSGVELSDSMSWNPHKMLGTPLQCSLLVIKEKGLLHQCNCVGAKYLFQQDKFYDVSYDTGDKSIQCGRKVDAFKLWCMWKARGTNGLESLINNAMSCSDYLKNKIGNMDGFRLVLNQFECSNICFWYIPKKLRGLKETDEWWVEIGKVAPAIKEKVTKKGSLMVGYTPLPHKKKVNFFRVITTCQPPSTIEDMDYLINEIQTVGDEL